MNKIIVLNNNKTDSNNNTYKKYIVIKSENIDKFARPRLYVF